MEKVVITVDGMSCEHCVKAIKGAVGALSGVKQVSVDLDSRSVTVDYDPGRITLDSIKQEIRDQGYDPL